MYNNLFIKVLRFFCVHIKMCWQSWEVHGTVADMTCSLQTLQKYKKVPMGFVVEHITLLYERGFSQLNGCFT